MSEELTVKALDAEAARSLTEEIRAAYALTFELVQDAYNGRAWAALGYGSWGAYCDEEFPHLRLSREERPQLVAALREVGMSSRSIASALGVDPKTVRSDLASQGEENSPPATVTGADGKLYPSTSGRRLTADEVWAEWLTGRKPWFVDLTDEEWKARLEVARDEPEDVEAMAIYSGVSPEVFDAALALCRATGDLSRDRLVSVLAALRS